MKRFLLTMAALVTWALPAKAITTEALLDSVQRTSFQFFWSEANPGNGLIRDRSQPGSPCSIASQGFGLSAICIGIDRGWVSRAAGRDRVLTALQTYWNGPQNDQPSGTIGYKGFFYHFLHMTTGHREWTSELSTIDTALLMAGVLDVKQYFTGSDPAEVQIRALADSLYFRVDWNWARNFNPAIRMGWTPETGFGGFGQWIGYNEAMILYILALGSPTFPVPASSWTAWTTGYSWQTHYGYSYVNFPPLFGHQYSHCWIDFRSTNDLYMRNRGITYFENSRRATLAQRAYCIANPFSRVGYGDSLWGLTAGDGPSGYIARGAPPAQNDDGTLSPTAPASSIPFAPEVAIPAVRNMYNSFPSTLWGPYGFRDAFNLTVNWWDQDYIGIDQGPMVIMIENYRSNGVWSRFMQNPHIQLGLQRAGFTAVLDAGDPPRGAPLTLEPAAPNPFSNQTTVRFRLGQATRVQLGLYDLGGREVARLVDGKRSAGEHAVTVDGRGLSSGVYFFKLQGDGPPLVQRCVLLR